MEESHPPLESLLLQKRTIYLFPFFLPQALFVSFLIIFTLRLKVLLLITCPTLLESV